MKCSACERGDHENCGLQSWCDCDDEGNGDPDAAMFPEFDPYDPSDRPPWISGGGAVYRGRGD